MTPIFPYEFLPLVEYISYSGHMENSSEVQLELPIFLKLKR